MKILILTLLFVCIATGVSGQNSNLKLEISGTVLDSASLKPLRTASVSLLAARDSAYMVATVTDGSGQFRLKNVPPGNYRLLVTFIGYRNASKLVIAQEIPQVKADTIWMNEQGNQLNEVVIKQESAPVTIKQDTIEFNAGAFKTEPNAQVEELLKKLPGIEVARDGSIRANGQAVNKVLVDGKPFFGNDPKIATRNLPAGIVDKVQVFDQSSDQSQFSGIDDGNRERTINITIKKDKGKGYFGQNAAGIGNAARYLGRLNVNRFNNGNGGQGKQLSIVGQANNLNQQNFTLADGSLPGQGAGAGGPVLMGEPGSGGQDFNLTPSNITEVKAAGINYRSEGAKLRWGKRAEMASSYFVNQAITTTDQKSRRENVLPGQSFFTDQTNYNRNKVTSHRFNGRFDFQLDSLTSLRISPTISWQKTSYNSLNNSLSRQQSGDSLNSGNTKYDLNGNAFSGYNNLLLMRKFRKEGRTFSANLNSVLSNGKSIAYNRSFNTFHDSTKSIAWNERLDQRNNQNNDALQNTLTFSFTEPLSLNKKLELKYAFIQNLNRQSRQVFDKNAENELYNLPDSSLSNRFTGLFSAHRAGAGLQIKRLRYGYTFGLDFQQSKLSADNLTTDLLITKNYTHLLPYALFSYTFPGNRNVRLQYRTRITAPSATQLQPVADNSNPLNIRIGNPSLRPEYYNTITFTYNGSTQAGQKSLFISGSLNLSENRINSATMLTNNGQRISQPINTKGYRAFNSFLAWSQRINPLKLTVSINTNANLTQNISPINDHDNVSKTTTLAQGLRVQSNYNGRIDFGIMGRISYQQARYSLLSQQNTKYWSQYATADIHWQLPFHLSITTNLTYTATSGRAAGYNQQFTLWNAVISKQFLKGRQGEVCLQVFDILN
ncbi:TonB-dependent receptor [Dyadobacter sp. CY323]|uniref:TonB-dependent receptor n=1 Tax=Dyadobacter sp. CY323 TaxID=2907302 RepID=UPI001F2111AB|nr:TonB-dependent receptor [Dyadobacter sp. CY323]MCE6991003.1 outer membrane beta-barrel protein [Dyadobacter sp. CY323]